MPEISGRKCVGLLAMADRMSHEAYLKLIMRLASFTPVKGKIEINGFVESTGDGYFIFVTLDGVTRLPIRSR